MEQQSCNPIFFENRSIYTGYWKNGLRHGKGRQVWDDESVYEEFWQNNTANGQGRLINTDGDVYLIKRLFKYHTDFKIFTQTKIIKGMKVHGKMTKLIEKENIFIQMVQNIKENGMKINTMASEQKYGMILSNMKGYMKWVKCMDKEYFYGQMAVSKKDNLSQMTQKDLEHIIGVINVFLKVNEKIIKWMGKKYFLGVMEEYILNHIKSMDMENLNGQMGKKQRIMEILKITQQRHIFKLVRD